MFDAAAACAIGREAREAGDAGYRPDVDDAAVTVRNHASGYGLRNKKRAAQIGFENLVPVFPRHFERGLANVAAGIVDEDVNLSEGRFGIGGKAPDALLVAYVEVERDGAPAQCLYFLLEFRKCLALEAVGRNETVSAAIDCTQKGGTVTLIGNIQPEVALPLQRVVTRQLRLQGSCASAGEYPQAIELIAAGKIKVKPLITAIAPLEEGPHWFERLHAREPNLMKVILTP